MMLPIDQDKFKDFTNGRKKTSIRKKIPVELLAFVQERKDTGRIYLLNGTC